MKKESEELQRKENKRTLRGKLSRIWTSVCEWFRRNDPYYWHELHLKSLLARTQCLDIFVTLRIKPGDQKERIRQITPKRLVVSISASDLMEYSYFEAKPVVSAPQTKGSQSDESSYNMAVDARSEFC